MSGWKLNKSNSLLYELQHTCFIQCILRIWGFDVWSSVQALYCKYLNISTDIPSLPHKHRCSTQWGDQRLAVHRAPLELWCNLTAQLLLFRLSEDSVMLSVFFSFFFLLLFQGLYCECDPLFVTLMVIMKMFCFISCTSYLIMNEICIYKDLLKRPLYFVPFVNWRRLCVFAKKMKS